MKKQDLLSELKNQNISSSNLKSKPSALLRKEIQKIGPSTVKKWMRDAEEKEAAKALKKSQSKMAESFGMTWKTWSGLHEKAENILSSFDTGHSMGCYRALYFDYSDKIAFARTNNTREYPKSCKHKPVYGNLFIKLTKKELEQIQNIEGVWTIVKPDCSAKWLSSTGKKQNYSVGWKNGFVVGTSHASTLELAKELEEKKQLMLQQAQENEEAFIGAVHVRATGACWEGIKAFCERHGLNPEFGYNLGYLKSLNDPFANRYLSAIKK